MVSGNSYAMPWIGEVPALVQAWYGGSEAGNAIASVLFGDVNPSGKLPFTFHKRLEDCAAHSIGDYPGDGENVEYKEGIFVGYRWTDKEGIEPQFAFGHGLSYTDFSYGKISLSSRSMSEDDVITVSIQVTNTGDRAGAEVVQLYVNDVRSSLPRPVKELKGFKKIWLAPGETAEVTFTIAEEVLSYYDPAVHGWVAEPGDFKVMVGSASDDIRSEARFRLTD